MRHARARPASGGVGAKLTLPLPGTNRHDSRRRSRPVTPRPVLAGVGLLLLLAAAPAAHGQAARASVAAETLRVGEPFALSVVVTSQMGEGVVLPGPGPLGDGSVEVVRELHRSHRFGGTAAPGLRVDSVVIEATAFALDTLVVPPVPVRVLARGDTVRVATASFTIPLAHLVARGDTTGALRPTRPPEPFGWPAWMIAALLAAALAVLGLAVYALRRPRAPATASAPRAEAPRTPYALLLDRLSALERAGTPGPDAARAFCIALTDAVRDYLATRLALPAPTMTSAVLAARLDDLERRGATGPGAADHARRVFATADLARYADARFTDGPLRDALDGARALAGAVEAARPTRPALPSSPPARTSPEPAGAQTALPPRSPVPPAG